MLTMVVHPRVLLHSLMNNQFSEWLSWHWQALLKPFLYGDVQLAHAWVTPLDLSAGFCTCRKAGLFRVHYFPFFPVCTLIPQCLLACPGLFTTYLLLAGKWTYQRKQEENKKIGRENEFVNKRGREKHPLKSHEYKVLYSTSHNGATNDLSKKKKC